jgi:hypothetical protein
MWPVGCSVTLAGNRDWIATRDTTWKLLFSRLFFTIYQEFGAQNGMSFMFDEKDGVKEYVDRFSINQRRKPSMTSSLGRSMALPSHLPMTKSRDSSRYRPPIYSRTNGDGAPPKSARNLTSRSGGPTSGCAPHVERMPSSITMIPPPWVESWSRLAVVHTSLSRC